MERACGKMGRQMWKGEKGWGEREGAVGVNKNGKRGHKKKLVFLGVSGPRDQFKLSL